MPNDTIDRGIKKAAGDGNSVNYEFCTYEGYGPSGTAIIVKCLTDNKTVLLQMSEMHSQKVMEASVHRVVYLTCSMKKDRSSSQKKTVRWMQTIL